MGIFDRIKDLVRFGAAVAKTQTPDNVDKVIDKVTEAVDIADSVEQTVRKAAPKRKARKEKTGDGR